jgi:tRNA threonylcarbamoyladenosine biosynthesis protein TsaE
MKEEGILVEDESMLNDLAKDLILFAGNNKVWAFFGEMGAGKTTFIRHICKELGVVENVSSPTFALINEYHDLSRNRFFILIFIVLKMCRRLLISAVKNIFKVVLFV